MGGLVRAVRVVWKQEVRDGLVVIVRERALKLKGYCHFVNMERDVITFYDVLLITLRITPDSVFVSLVFVVPGLVRGEEGVRRPEDGVRVLGEELHHPGLVHRVNQARERGRSFRGLEESWTKN